MDTGCVLRSSLRRWVMLEPLFVQLAVWNQERTLQTPPMFSPETTLKGKGFSELKVCLYFQINNSNGASLFSELLLLSEGPWVTCPVLARELWLFAAVPCTLSWEEPLLKVWEASGTGNSQQIWEKMWPGHCFMPQPFSIPLGQCCTTS